MEQNYTDKKPIRATLRDMEIGDIINFPKSRTSVVRSSASAAKVAIDFNKSTTQMGNSASRG